MKVEAVRDDGALLVTEGQAAAVVIDDQIATLLSRDSALSKGVPWIAAMDQRVPMGIVDQLGVLLARLDAELREE